MSRESGQDRSQKTVAELLALHGGNVDSGRRRRRRAADDDEQGGNVAEIASRRHGGNDTQAIINRVRGDAATPQRSSGGRRALPDPAEGTAPRRQAPEPSAPRPDPEATAPRPPARAPQPSGHFPRPDASSTPPPANRPAHESGHFARPAHPAPAPESGAFPRPGGTPAHESGTFARPNGAPPESGAFPRPKASPAPESGTFKRPNAAPAPESGAFPQPGTAPAPESGTFPRPNGAAESGAFTAGGTGLPTRRARRVDPQALRKQQDSAAMPLPDAPTADDLPRRHQDTRSQLPRRGAPVPPAGSVAARLDGLEAPAGEEAPPEPGGMASGAFPAPPRRRRAAAPPEEEPHTEQFQAVDAPTETGFEPPAPDAPPAGLPGRRIRGVDGSRASHPAPGSDAEATEVGVMPVVPREEDEEPEHDPGDDLEATGFHDPFADDDEDEFDAFAEPEQSEEYSYEEQEVSYTEQEDDEQPAEDAEADDAEPSSAKQWLSMAVQLALGVVGGAAVWLGFNWLWGKIPAAALIAAVVVIAGLVWIVRKLRRAEDLQTTVLAVLVGLVVTVSPAALLLLSR